MKSLGLAAGTVAFLTACGRAPEEQGSAPEGEGRAAPARPNLVLVIADDLDPRHLGFTGLPVARTPNLDALAARGVCFDRFYVQPVCRPALATLLSGRWPHETGIVSNQVKEPLDGEGTLPALLHGAGYATFCGGKFWEEDLAAFGFDAPEVDDPEFGRNAGNPAQDELFDFLDEHGDQPFFVWWAPSLPHTPHRSPERIYKPFAKAEIAPPPGYKGSPKEFQAAERASLAMHNWLDEEFGHFLAKLRAEDELEDTVFFFFGDNGWSTFRHAKGTPREKGVRSPLVVSGPGVQTGALPALVDLVDVHATVLDLAGVPLPPDARGQSLRAALEGRPFEGRDRLFGAAYSKREAASPAEEVYALYVRDAQWKYVLYVRDVKPMELSPGARSAPPFQRKRGHQELLDLAADPEEEHNLASDPAQSGRCAEMKAAVLAWWQETGGGEIPGL